MLSVPIPGHPVHDSMFISIVRAHCFLLAFVCELVCVCVSDLDGDIFVNLREPVSKEW